jgi:very-short-patch-repair endonuclease
MLPAVDLYREAQRFPGTLLGRGITGSTAKLEQSGLHRSARHWRARHGQVSRVVRGAYVLGQREPDLLDRARAALAVCGSECVVGFHTAAAFLGFGIERDAAIHVVVPQGRPFPTHQGIRVHQSVVPIAPIVWQGVACTPPARTAVDLARVLARPSALAVLDATLASGASDVDDLLAEIGRHRGLKGIRRVRDLVSLADSRAQCRQESHLRMILHDAGLRGFEPQVPVCDAYGVLRYYLDLADRRRRVAAEYDGASHLERESLRNDRERHNWLDQQGWRMRYFTDRDLYRRPDWIVDTLRAAIRGR